MLFSQTQLHGRLKQPLRQILTPTSDVVLTITSSDTGEATVNSPLTFTAGNWNTPQTVTITGVNDNLVDGTITSTVTVAVNDGNSDNNFDPVADQTVSISTTDNDNAGFTITETGGSTTVAETGTTDTFAVVLTAQPSSDVVLSITSGDTGEAVVNGSTGSNNILTFTSGNWNTPQSFTVTGVDDNLVDGTTTTTATGTTTTTTVSTVSSTPTSSAY